MPPLAQLCPSGADVHVVRLDSLGVSINPTTAAWGLWGPWRAFLQICPLVSVSSGGDRRAIPPAALFSPVPPSSEPAMSLRGIPCEAGQRLALETQLSPSVLLPDTSSGNLEKVLIVAPKKGSGSGKYLGS